jgi:hypothetical protein
VAQPIWHPDLPRRSGQTDPGTSATASVEYRFTSFADAHPEFVGYIGLLELAYAIGPVIHRWTLQASWWQDTQQKYDGVADHDDEAAATTGATSTTIRPGCSPRAIWIRVGPRTRTWPRW